MNIELLVKMANEISLFFASGSAPTQAARDVATHMKRFWEPRMRRQIVTYYEKGQGEGLNDLAREAVALLAAEARLSNSA
jgi:formate dehydrogenase subunit delta